MQRFKFDLQVQSCILLLFFSLKFEDHSQARTLQLGLKLGAQLQYKPNKSD
jgi:hypothetical protein